MLKGEAINYGTKLREQATEMCQEGQRGSILIEDCEELKQFLDVALYQMQWGYRDGWNSAREGIVEDYRECVAIREMEKGQKG